MNNTYIGRCKETAFCITVNDAAPLPLHALYLDRHDWSVEDGIRQVALDLMLHHLNEHPTPPQLAAREQALCAWYPHRHYGPVLSGLLVPFTDEMYWRLDDLQLALWLEDWMLLHHQRSSRERFGQVSRLSYPAWEQELQSRLDAAALKLAELSRPWRFRAYLTGETPERTLLRNTHSFASPELDETGITR